MQGHLKKRVRKERKTRANAEKNTRERIVRINMTHNRVTSCFELHYLPLCKYPEAVFSKLFQLYVTKIRKLQRTETLSSRSRIQFKVEVKAV